MFELGAYARASHSTDYLAWRLDRLEITATEVRAFSLHAFTERCISFKSVLRKRAIKCKHFNRKCSKDEVAKFAIEPNAAGPSRISFVEGTSGARAEILQRLSR